MQPCHWPLFKRHLLVELALRRELPDEVAHHIYTLYLAVSGTDTYQQVLDKLVSEVERNWRVDYKLTLLNARGVTASHLIVHQRSPDKTFVLSIERILLPLPCSSDFHFYESLYTREVVRFDASHLADKDRVLARLLSYINLCGISSIQHVPRQGRLALAFAMPYYHRRGDLIECHAFLTLSTHSDVGWVRANQFYNAQGECKPRFALQPLPFKSSAGLNGCWQLERFYPDAI